MRNIWNYLSGKKTVISAVLVLTVTFLHTRGVIDAATTEYLQLLNATILGVGVGHKIQKASK